MHCKDNVFQFAFAEGGPAEGGPAVPAVAGQDVNDDDSHVDRDDDDSSLSSSSSEEETGDSTALGNRWKNGVNHLF